MFKIPASRKNEVIYEIKAAKSKSKSLFNILKKFSKKMKPPEFGRDAIARRLSQFDIPLLDYKHCKFDYGVAEVALIDSKFNIVGVNGSFIFPSGFHLAKSEVPYAENEAQSNITILKTVDSLFPINNKKAYIYILYSSTKPSYSDANKTIVEHFDDCKLYRAIERFYKKNEPDEPDDKKQSKKEWILKDYDLTVKDSAAEKFNMTNRIYLFLHDAKAKAEEMFKRYGQITLRQLYYQLVSSGIIRNNESSYKNYISNMTKAREKGMIEPDLFEDRSRYVISPDVIIVEKNVKSHIEEAINESLIMPEIDVWASQIYYLEIWIEKDALVTLFSKVASEKQVALFPSRGYTSYTKMHEALNRYREHMQSGKKGVLLYFGDLDPSGLDIYKNIKNKFKDSCLDIEVKRLALEAKDTSGLLPMPIKESDARSEDFKKFMAQNQLEGCFELDAMDPDKLLTLARSAIGEYFDESMVPRDRIKTWEENFKLIKADILVKLNFDKN